MGDIREVVSYKGVAPPWGVWDRHDRRWLVEGLAWERDALAAQLTVESLHPWELEVKQDQESPGVVVDVEYECPKCGGDGYCDHCDEECRKCDGVGWLDAKRWAAHLADQKRREEARAAARARYAAGDQETGAALQVTL